MLSHLSSTCSSALGLKSILHKPRIDGVVASLYYRVTVGMLAAASVLVGAKEYYGDPIDCEVDGMTREVMDNYCWVTGTYTVDDYFNVTEANRVKAVHPGVGFKGGARARTYHRYYQWVPLVLLLAAVRFYVPRFLWKILEDQKMSFVTSGGAARNAVSSDVGEERRAYDSFQRRAFLSVVGTAGAASNGNLAYALNHFVCCHLLNPLALLTFLLGPSFAVGGDLSTLDLVEFYCGLTADLLPSADSSSSEWATGPLERLFPKVTMCTFRKGAPNGRVSEMQGICVLPLNIVNEKIFTVLWFWYCALLLASAVSVLDRIAEVACPCLRIHRLLSRCQSGRSSSWLYRDVVLIVRKIGYADFFVLARLGHNVSPVSFQDLIRDIARHFKKIKHEQDMLEAGMSLRRRSGSSPCFGGGGLAATMPASSKSAEAGDCCNTLTKRRKRRSQEDVSGIGINDGGINDGDDGPDDTKSEEA